MLAHEVGACFQPPGRGAFYPLESPLHLHFHLRHATISVASRDPQLQKLSLVVTALCCDTMFDVAASANGITMAHWPSSSPWIVSNAHAHFREGCHATDLESAKIAVSVSWHATFECLNRHAGR